MTDSTELKRAYPKLERVLDAPRELLRKAWTGPEHIKRWWAQRPYQAPEVSRDLSVRA